MISEARGGRRSVVPWGHGLALTVASRVPGHTAQMRQSRGRAIAARRRALEDRAAAFGTDVDAAVYRERIWPR